MNNKDRNRNEMKAIAAWIKHAIYKERPVDVFGLRNN